MNSERVVHRSVLAVAFAGLLASGAYAQSQDPTPQQQDIQNDKKDIRNDKKDLAKDRADRNADQRDIDHDKGDLAKDRSNPRAESARARLPTTGRSTTVVVIGIASPASLIWTEVTGAWVCQGRRRTIDSHRAARPSCVGCIVSSWRISWWAVTRRTEPGRKTVCCPAPSS